MADDTSVTTRTLGEFLLESIEAFVARSNSAAASLVHPDHPWSGRESSNQPDLREVVRDTGDAKWVDEIYDAMRQHGDQVQLIECCYKPGDDGFTAIAAIDESASIPTERGDTVLAGFGAVRAGQNNLQMWPRHLRVACTNGLPLPGRPGTELIAAGSSPAEAVAHCFSPAHTLEAANIFQSMRRRVIPRYPSVLDAPNLTDDLSPRDARELQNSNLKDDLSREVAAAFEGMTAGGSALDLSSALNRLMARETRGCTTPWEVLNAITADARAAPDLLSRLAYERIGARLIRPLVEDEGQAGPTLETLERSAADRRRRRASAPRALAAKT